MIKMPSKEQIKRFKEIVKVIKIENKYLYLTNDIYLPWLSLSNEPIVLGKGTIIKRRKFEEYFDDKLEWKILPQKIKSCLKEFDKKDIDKYLMKNKIIFY